MFVFEAEKIDSRILRTFLERHEMRCVQLCAFARKTEQKDSQNIFVFSDSTKIKSERDIFGVISFDSTILHCLPFLSLEKKNDEFDKAFLKLIECNNLNGQVRLGQIHCVNGEKSASEYIINLLVNHEKKIYQKNEYFLMTKDDLNGIPFPASLLSMGEEIFSCGLNNADDLCDLQKNYLIEEVAPKGVKTTDEHVKSNIEKILREQKMFAILSDGQFIAKANTNAIGWNWIQIGGVYTNPLYRRNNYALCLVSALIRHINKNGRKTCLFVNKKNVPAISLYKKMKFTTDCEFVICYFE